MESVLESFEILYIEMVCFELQLGANHILPLRSLCAFVCVWFEEEGGGFSGSRIQTF